MSQPDLTPAARAEQIYQEVHRQFFKAYHQGRSDFGSEDQTKGLWIRGITTALRAVEQATWEKAAKVLQERLHFDLGTGECHCREHDLLREFRRRSTNAG